VKGIVLVLESDPTEKELRHFDYIVVKGKVVKNRDGDETDWKDLKKRLPDCLTTKRRRDYIREPQA
jgi:hypothetical protein